MATGSTTPCAQGRFIAPLLGPKKAWKRPLGLKIGSPVEDVLSAWKELHQTFETSLANIKERNPHILDKRERRRQAEAHLKMFNLRTRRVTRGD